MAAKELRITQELDSNLEDRLTGHLHFNFDRFKDSDLEQLIQFQKQAYSDQYNASDYREDDVIKRRFVWKYLDNPNRTNKDRPFIWLARFKGLIIAQICIMPYEVKIENNLYKAGWCQDFIAHQEFRNKGIGYFLIRHILGELKKEMDLLFVAGTNKYAYPLFKLAGFTDIALLPRYIKILTPSKGDRHSKCCGDDDSSKNFNLDFEETWNKFKAEIKYIFKRDKKSIIWRFVNQPWYKYRIFSVMANNKVNGYIMLRKGSFRDHKLNRFKVGLISDMFFCPGDKKTIDTLLGKAIKYFKDEGMNLIRLDILAPGLNFALMRRGFFRAPSSNRFIFFCLNRDLMARETLLRKSKDWFLTFFDSDFDLL